MAMEQDRRFALKVLGSAVVTAGFTSRAIAENEGSPVTSLGGIPPNTVHYRTAKVGDVDVFYREAGPKNAPVILLLHGFPTSSHMFRELIPQLAGSFRLIAPDLPGFGLTKAPSREHYAYTFDNLAKTIDGFIDVLGLGKYALYVFDYGAPTGFRLAAAHRQRVTAIITQNGNAYEDGLGSDKSLLERRFSEEPRCVAGHTDARSDERPVRSRRRRKRRLTRWLHARFRLSATARNRRDPARSFP